MSVTVTIPTPKDVVKSVSKSIRFVGAMAELSVLSGVKRVANAVSEKADNLNEKIDEHAVKKYIAE